MYLEVEVLGHRETLYLTFQETADFFLKELCYVTFWITMHEGSISPYLCKHLSFSIIRLIFDFHDFHRRTDKACMWEDGIS